VKIGVVCLSLSCMDFIDVLDFVQDVGGEAIELCTVKGAHNGTLNLSDENRLSILRTVESFGLSIASVAGYNDFTSHVTDELQREVERLEYYCKLAADLSVNIVRAMGGDPKPGLSKSQMVRNIIQGFKIAVEMADQYGVTLALENHGTVTNNGSTLMKIIDEVASDNLGLTLDTGNFCWAGFSLEESYEYFNQLVPYVVNVHLKDVVSDVGNKAKFVPLGQGKMDLRRIVTLLADHGYQGALLCEYEGMGDPKELLQSGVFRQEKYVQELKAGTKQSLAYLKSLMQ
jgi:hydroxypyruvate isomerase